MLLSAAFGVGTSWSFFQITAGLFIIPMQAEFGWSRSATAIAPIGALISTLFYPFAGALIDRWGPRRMSIIGLVGLSAGFVLFAIEPANKAFVHTVLVYVSIVGAISNPIIFSKGVATWFVRNIGMAVGLMQTGISVATAIGIPLLSMMIARHGWRSGYLAMAGVIAFVSLPPVLLWFRTPPQFQPGSADVNLVPGHSFSEAVRDRRFWQMFASFVIVAIPIGGFIGHFTPLLIGLGATQPEAAGWGSLFVVSIGIGRFGVGILLDRVRPSFAAGGSLALAAVGALALGLIGTANGLLLGLAISMIGIAQGAEFDYASFFAVRTFGLRSYSKLVGVFSMALGAGMAVGGFLFSAAYDHYGNYKIAIFASAVTYAAAAVLISLIKVPIRTETQ